MEPPPQLPDERPSGPQLLVRWAKFCVACSIVIATQVLDVWLIVRLFQQGNFELPWLMILGFFYSRGNRAYRGIAGFHFQTDKFADACKTFFKTPSRMLISFFRLDEIQAQYGVLILRHPPKKLATLNLTTAMSDQVLQMYLKVISVVFYWQESAGFGEYGWMLLSTVGCAFSICVAFLQWELLAAKDNGFARPPVVSGYALCHFLTRMSELVGRCMGVATWVVFFPFPVWTAVVLVTEEVLIIITVIVAKAYQTPDFLSTMRTGRCGPFKLYGYMLVVMWPMYWCMHTQTYHTAVPRPAFSYRRYYLTRIPFAWGRTLALFFALRFGVPTDAARLVQVIFASIAGTAAWMVLWPVVRRMAVRLHGTKEAPKEVDNSVAVVPQADSGKPPAGNPLAERPRAETDTAKPPAGADLEQVPSGSDAEVPVQEAVGVRWSVPTIREVASEGAAHPESSGEDEGSVPEGVGPRGSAPFSGTASETVLFQSSPRGSRFNLSSVGLQMSEFDEAEGAPSDPFSPSGSEAVLLQGQASPPRLNLSSLQRQLNEFDGEQGFAFPASAPQAPRALSQSSLGSVAFQSRASARDSRLTLPSLQLRVDDLPEPQPSLPNSTET